MWPMPREMKDIENSSVAKLIVKTITGKCGLVEFDERLPLPILKTLAGPVPASPIECWKWGSRHKAAKTERRQTFNNSFC